MRRNCFIVLLLSAGCITGSAAMQRDDRILREIGRQERWARQAIDAKPAKDQLESIRGSDYGSVGAARKEFVKLVQAVDRATWIRDTTAELMRDDRDPQLLHAFDRAGALRVDALQAADELASALADAKGGLTMADLRPAMNSLSKAQASEERLAKLPPPPQMPRLIPSPVPVPRPFQDAAARIAHENPESARDIDRLSPEEQTKIRARMADIDREKEEQKHAEPNPQITGSGTPAPAPKAEKPASATPAPEAGGEMEAPAPSTTLKVAGDAAAQLAKKAPLAITLREDGLFALSYDDGEYLYDPDGKFVRKEAAEPAPPAPAKK